MPPLTQALIITNVVVFMLQQLFGRAFTQMFALWPLSSGWFMPWQVVSYAFLHGNLTHIAFNMFGIWMFGRELEGLWGKQRLATFYLASVLMAAALQLLVASTLGIMAPTIGASGGLFGLMLGFAMMFPQRTIVPLIPPIPMPGCLSRSMAWLS